MKEIAGCFLAELEDPSYDMYVHQANCQGVMGAGLAKHIGRRFPELVTGDPTKLGTYDAIETNGIVVANIYGQLYYGRDKRYTNYSALCGGLLMLIEDYCPQTVAIPKGMGCGLGGGDWNTVVDILEGIEEITRVEFIVINKEGS